MTNHGRILTELLGNFHVVAMIILGVLGRLYIECIFTWRFSSCLEYMSMKFDHCVFCMHLQKLVAQLVDLQIIMRFRTNGA